MDHNDELRIYITGIVRDFPFIKQVYLVEEDQPHHYYDLRFILQPDTFEKEHIVCEIYGWIMNHFSDLLFDILILDATLIAEHDLAGYQLIYDTMEAI
jgi:hypothetical protein